MKCKYCNKEVRIKKGYTNFCNVSCYQKWYRKTNLSKLKNYRKKWHNDNYEKVKQQNYQYKLENPEKIKLWKQTGYKRNKKKILEDNKLRRLKHPEKVKAQQIARSTLKPHVKCDICGSRKNLEMHHWRYDKPLLVNTLCKTCHSIQHVKRRRNK